MTLKIELLALHPHVNRKQMVLLLKRGHTTYALRTGMMYAPEFVTEVQGRVTVMHTREHGSEMYHQKIIADLVTRNTPILDPICEAVLERGWNIQKIKMAHYLDRKWEWFPETFTFKFEDLPLKRKYTPTRTRYAITEHRRSKTKGSDPNFCWTIIVDYRPLEEEYRASEFSVDFHARVPEIYDKPESLAAFLKAIKSLPHARRMKGLHPVQRAERKHQSGVEART